MKKEKKVDRKCRERESLYTYREKETERDTERKKERQSERDRERESDISVLEIEKITDRKFYFPHF